MCRILLLLALVALPAGGGAPAEGQTTFRSGTDLVGINITVTHRRGNFVTDLRPEEVDILEDGVPQEIRVFAPAGDVESAPELHIGLLFDTSGSMGDDIDLARSAAIRFLNTLTEAEDMTLVDFDTEIRVARYEQSNFPRMVERIRGRKPGGMTAMYDALAVYLTGASEDTGRKILVLFSDGGDTRSTTSFSKVLTMLRASDATVYAIGFLDHQPSGQRFEQRQRLTRIATEAGGEAFFPNDMTRVDEAYAKILNQIRAQYTIGYVSTNTRQDGEWRTVDIRIRRPDLDGPRVQARKGYYAPLAP